MDRDPLADTKAFLQQEIAPIATQLDQDSAQLQQAFLAMGNRHLLALKVPQVDQGWGVNEITFCRFQEQVARYSGALAFLQTQHQSAASWLAQSSNLRLKQTYLPGMSSGQVRIGIGFSQLRRVERPSVTAQSVDGGYLLQGTVPWVTGFGCFQWFVIGAALANGQAVFGLVPFEHQIQATGGNIRFSEPIALAAMGSTNTVEAYLENWFLPDDQVIAVKEPGWITTNDQRHP
jgi:alkylation response protein AidB-like acyl-CoA dehydrogenase